MEEVNGTGCKAALYHMRDMWDVNSPSSSVCAHHDHALPAHKSTAGERGSRYRGQSVHNLGAHFCFRSNTSHLCLHCRPLRASSPVLLVPETCALCLL